jgi:hypothetical protein
MEYALLIYREETVVPQMAPGDREELFAAYRAYSDSLREAGAYRGAVKLVNTTAATSVRVRNGRTLTTDGPFAETKEQLAGLYVVECESLDEALECASRLPGARLGTIEVRPVEFRG